jgi:hypothetical protein
MMMRDLQRLEALSSAAALGLWADDIVLALDRVTSGAGFVDADRQLLNDAAEMLEATLERTEQPLSRPRSARSLAATNTALSIVATLVREHPGTDEQEILRDMAAILREAAEGTVGTDDAERVEPVMALFGLLGEHQLVESNSVLASRNDPSVWSATPSTSNSS